MRGATRLVPATRVRDETYPEGDGTRADSSDSIGMRKRLSDKGGNTHSEREVDTREFHNLARAVIKA